MAPTNKMTRSSNSPTAFTRSTLRSLTLLILFDFNAVEFQCNCIGQESFAEFTQHMWLCNYFWPCDDGLEVEQKMLKRKNGSTSCVVGYGNCGITRTIRIAHIPKLGQKKENHRREAHLNIPIVIKSCHVPIPVIKLRYISVPSKKRVPFLLLSVAAHPVICLPFPIRFKIMKIDDNTTHHPNHGTQQTKFGY